jgi:hypothetical protein
MEVTIGVELELGVADAEGSPVNVLRTLNGGIELGRPFHAVTGELSRYSAEFVTPICRDKAEVQEALWKCAEALPQGLRRVHKTIPFKWPVPLAEYKYKPRYPVVRRALRREHPCGSFTLHSVAPHCSTQLQIGVGDVHSTAGVLLRNFLDNIAPYADVMVRRRYNVTDAKQHLMIWLGWSKPERVPGYRWFRDAKEMNEFVRSIPQLVALSPEGEWVVAEGLHSEIGNPLSEGTIWWLARPRGAYQTIEWRSFPALTIEDAVDLSGDVFAMMEEFWNYVESRPRATWRTPEEARGLYRHLSRFYFVPVEPLTEAQWMNYFVQ